MDYQGVKIPKKIIIVSRPNGIHKYSSRDNLYECNYEYAPAYIVDPESKGMLDSALSWARTTYTKQDENGNFIVDYIDKNGKEWYKNHQVEGIQSEYDNNGQFEFELYDSAGGSYQGGKLSFWNCRIIAPDGKKFQIGINSDILLNLLQHNTFVNGKCQEKVYLGRIKGNAVGAFTKNMELFKQAEYDDSIRKASKTSKYKPGDYVRSKINRYIYLGEIYRLFDFKHLNHGHWYFNKGGEDLIVRYDKPIKQHLYAVLHDGNFDEQGNIIDIEKGWFELKDSKTAYIVDGRSVKVGTPHEQYIKHYEYVYKERLENEKNYGWGHDEDYAGKAYAAKIQVSDKNVPIDIEELLKHLDSDELLKTNVFRYFTRLYKHPKTGEYTGTWKPHYVVSQETYEELRSKYKEYN